jgi:hypothetical protein
MFFFSALCRFVCVGGACGTGRWWVVVRERARPALVRRVFFFRSVVPHTSAEKGLARDRRCFIPLPGSALSSAVRSTRHLAQARARAGARDNLGTADREGKSERGGACGGGVGENRRPLDGRPPAETTGRTPTGRPLTSRTCYLGGRVCAPPKEPRTTKNIVKSARVFLFLVFWGIRKTRVHQQAPAPHPSTKTKASTRPRCPAAPPSAPAPAEAGAAV